MELLSDEGEEKINYFLDDFRKIKFEKSKFDFSRKTYEDGDLRIGLRGGATTLGVRRFLESARIAIKIGTSKVEVKSFLLHKKLSKSVH